VRLEPTDVAPFQVQTVDIDLAVLFVPGPRALDAAAECIGNDGHAEVGLSAGARSGIRHAAGDHATPVTAIVSRRWPTSLPVGGRPVMVRDYFGTSPGSDLTV
jgi:hypothetical protein